MGEAQHSIEIDISPKNFYEIVIDFDAYPEFLDEVKGISILEMNAKTAQVEYEVQLIKSFKYMLDFEFVKNKSVKWRLVKSSFFKKNDGSWTLEPLDKGKRTKATYWVDIEMGFVPQKIMTWLTQEQLPKMLKIFKERAESLY